MSGEMKPIAYVQELHFAEVELWTKAHNEFITPDALPQIGFIVPGTAAGFLYRTDSSVALVESLVASKDSGPAERSQALDAIVLALCLEAKKLGFKTVLGSTQLDAIVKRAVRLGWSYVGGGFHMVALPLSSLP